MSAATRPRSWARRLLFLLEEPFIRPSRTRLLRQSARGSIDTSRRWRGRRPVAILAFFSYLGAIALVVVVVWGFVVLAIGPGILTRLNERCDLYTASCGAEVGFLIPLLSVALASAIFLFSRRRLVKKAKIAPQDLVETATPDIGEVVGRDELCRVIMEDIRYSATRRPHLLVGGLGAGKTAVLVRLTRLLAERGAVPVPIRLRDATFDLNFREMARYRFLVMAESTLSPDNAEKAWRQLSKNDQIVVIADGLEEALTEGGAGIYQDRDSLIRLAIHRARELRLPLIIASRPHDSLRGADATIMELEPLSEEAALEYIDPDPNSDHVRWLHWIVETAGLTELPLYLQITRQLSRRDRLDYFSTERSAQLDVRGIDRSKLRLHLLATWMETLFDGHLMGAVPLNRSEREATVEWLSALACIGLLGDTIDVKYEDYYEGNPANQLEASQAPKYQEIDHEIQRFLNQKLPRRHLDIRLAVTWGDRLNLVKAHAEGMRFPHSIMQAYLASRFMSTALQDSKFQQDAVARLRNPGREFLIALVLYARSVDTDRKGRRGSEPQWASAERTPAAAAEPGAAGTPGASRNEPEVSESNAPGAGTATATSMPPGPAQDSADGQIPFGGLSTGPTQASSGPTLGSDVRSIRDLLVFSALEARDDVKMLDLYAAALEIDSFLDESRHKEIARSVSDRWDDIRGWDQRTIDEAKLGLVLRFGDAVRTVADRPARGLSRFKPAYGELLEMGCSELSYPIRLAIAQEIGAGGDEAFRVLRQPSYEASGNIWENAAWPNGTANAKKSEKKGRQDGRSWNADKNRTLRGRILCAWLTPLLAGSVEEFWDEARQELGLWIDRVGRDQEGDGNYFNASLEVALAQGFKYAANRRIRHPHAFPATRSYMAEQAMEMLKRARFWFTQLTLIQALCLWEMPEPSMSRYDRTGRRGNGYPDQRGSNPEATVGYWLEMARNGKHPFVAEAGNLAVEALKTGHPERFLWIDESGIVSSVGSRAALATKEWKHDLWIAPSAGWAALDPRALQLVADVLLLLNLVERGEGPGDVEQRLRRVEGSDLPPCFTRNRYSLDPKTTVGNMFRAPGSNCIDGCRHRLCPYPPDGVQPYRSELSEAFCRRQQTLLNRGLSAPWQTILRADLKRFWAQMADRARGVSTDPDRD
jgi:hypothetical protein